MILKSDPKFKEKLTCSSKHDISNLVNFHPITQKFENSTWIGSFSPKYKGLRQKKEGLSFMTLSSDAKFEKTLTLWFQNWHEDFGELLLKRSKI